jgi:serine/threonine-protein kinase
VVATEEVELARVLEAGSTFAGFRIEAVIGGHGAQRVYRAVEGELGRVVTLRVLPADPATDAGFRQRFIAEARAVSQIDHPNVLPIYSFGEEDGLLFLAARFVPDGMDLPRHVRQHGPLEPLDAVLVATQAARALDAAHLAGVVHGTLRAENLVLVNSRGDDPPHLYVTGFGSADDENQDAGRPAHVADAWNRAPEQGTGRDPDGKVDQYALARLLYDCFATPTPTDGLPSDEHTADPTGRPLPPLSTIRPDLPSAVDGVLAQALAPDPRDRFGSCLELADALRLALLPRLDIDDGKTRIAAVPGSPLVAPASPDAPTAAPGRRDATGGDHAPLPAASASHGALPSPRSARRRALAWAAATTTVLLLAAAIAFGAGRGDRSGQPAAQPVVPGGTARLVARSLPPAWDPVHTTPDTEDMVLLRAVFDPLMTVTADGPVPFLAEAVEPNGDFTDWTIRLRPDVRFHDGAALTADVVRANLEARLQQPPARAELAPVTEVRTVDDRTVTVRMRSSWPAFTAALTGPSGLIVGPSMLGEPGRPPIGTGPFTVRDASPSSAVLEKQATYWRPGEPMLDRITLAAVPEPTSRTDEPANGRAQLAIIGRTGSEGAEPSGERVPAGSSVLAVIFNPRDPLLTDAAARRAVATALGTSTDAPLHEGPTDRTTATTAPTSSTGDDLRAALDASLGTQGNRRITVLYTDEDEPSPELTASIREQLRSAEVQVIGKRETPDAVIVNVRNGTFQVAIIEVPLGTDADALYPLLWAHAAGQPIAELAASDGVITGDPGAAIAAELDRARAESDPETRRQAYRRSLELLTEVGTVAWVTRLDLSVVAGDGLGFADTVGSPLARAGRQG